MQNLAGQPEAFVRPSPSAKRLGGVSRSTRESILICEAAGFDIVLVETVGAGQSEYEVSEMVDFFVVLVMPNAGDEIQGMKRGLIELADVVLVNKSDGSLKQDAAIARTRYDAALRLMQPHSFWVPRVLECSALEGTAIDQVWQMVDSYFDAAIDNGHLEERRAAQRAGWMSSLFLHELERIAMGKPGVRATLELMREQVIAGKVMPYAAVQRIVELL
jgi:LAO/AO transport system kinase